MDDSYRQFFALQSEPFRADIKRGDIMVTPALSAVQDRVQYAVRLGAVALITGEIGSGKSTALRYVIGDFHPSEYNRLAPAGSRSIRPPTSSAADQVFAPAVASVVTVVTR